MAYWDLGFQFKALDMESVPGECIASEVGINQTGV